MKFKTLRRLQHKKKSTRRIKWKLLMQNLLQRTLRVKRRGGAGGEETRVMQTVSQKPELDLVKQS